MINSLGFIADQFRFNPYDTLASSWNEYPWFVGADNSSMIERTELSQFAVRQSQWVFHERHERMQSAELTLGGLVAIQFDAKLIVMDQYGRVGTDVGPSPDQLPSEHPISPAVTFVGIQSERVVFEIDYSLEHKAGPAVAFVSAKGVYRLIEHSNDQGNDVLSVSPAIHFVGISSNAS